jgi:two-component system NarL family response regulator
MKVLIADDDRMALELHRRVLERAGMDVVGMTSEGAPVVSLALRRRPDVVLLALALHEPTGRSCLDALRDAQPHLCVVVINASASPYDIRAALARGARAYVVRRLNPVDLPATLRQAHDGTVFHLAGEIQAPDEALRLAGLTPRELEMLQAVARGLSNKAIGQELWVTEQTVKFHLGNLYRKLGVPNRTAAAGYAHAHGLAA